MLLITIGHLGVFPSLKEKVNSHSHTLWSLKTTSGVRIEPEGEEGQIVQTYYRDSINKCKASLKNNARFWFSMYIENRVPKLHSADGWKAVKSKFLTHFNPIGSTRNNR